MFPSHASAPAGAKLPLEAAAAAACARCCLRNAVFARRICRLTANFFDILCVTELKLPALDTNVL